MTVDQQKVHDQLLNWLINDPDTSRPAVFSGYAGVGKSFVLGKLVDSLKQERRYWNIGITAPTHKAVKVLKKFAIPGVSYRTLHSMLALREQIDHVTGDVSYAPEKFQKEPPPITDLNVLIIDEVSMLTNDLFTYLAPYVKKGLKIIFTGDRAQIPPVKHKDCIPFLKADEWKLPQSSLTEVMRQKSGNPILEFATEIRNNQQTGTFIPKQHVLENGEGIQLVQHASAQEHSVLEEYFSNSKFDEDSDFMKVIAWRNITVNKYNEIIRHILYRTHLHISDIMLGEKLLMDRPYVINARNILTKNEEIEVKSITTIIKQLSYRDEVGNDDSVNCKFYCLDVEWLTDKEVKRGEIITIHESSKNDYLNIIDKLKQRALRASAESKGKMWAQYYKMIEQSAWVKYNYAVTAHTSQGSTYDNALVLKWDIDYNNNIEERNRILYVACTRARNTLFIEL